MSHVRLPGLALLSIFPLLFAVACGSSAPASPAAAVSAGPDSPRLAAKGLAFDKAVLQLPAGHAFALVFDNQEGVPHNVSIHAPDGSAVFTGEVFTGPGQRVYSVPALPVGTYSFQCDVHPQMKGAATAQ